MSWAEWAGEVWEPTKDEARLSVHLWPPEAGCPRVSWSLSLRHYVISESPGGGRKMQRWFDFEVSDLAFHERDWRRLAGREIKGDAAWHAAQEHTGEYGHLDVGEVNFRPVDLRLPPEQRPTPEELTWCGHAFVVRFGTREGLVFPCEIHAWLLPRSEYYRTQPEAPEELAFPTTPPNLRIVTRAVFRGGQITMPRCGDDPLPLARQFLREETGWEECCEPQVEWTPQRTADGQQTERRVGGSSTVRFRTEPGQTAQ